MDTLTLVKITMFIGVIFIMSFIPMFMFRKIPSSNSYINIMSIVGAVGMGFLAFSFFANYFQLSLN